MNITKIELNNFRNLSSVHLSAESGVNVIYGENAQGKTNIIEGIWLFTGLKSFRGSKDNELIKFNEEFAKKMTSLCSLADIILPNITEACFMTDTEYVDGVQTKDYVEELLNKLLDLGVGSVILTGV